MVETDQLIQSELERLAPAAETMSGTWQQVLARAIDSLPQQRRRWRAYARVALVAAAVVLVVGAPAVALSASLRSFLGFGSAPSPKFAQAQLMVTAPVPGGRVARLWLAPSSQGGQCAFVTVDRRGAMAKPKQMSGGGSCSIGATRFHGRLSWGFSSATPPIINGRAATSLHASRIELRWHGGSQQLAYRRGYFIAAAPGLENPAFRRLPYDVVVLDPHGRVIAKSRIPTSLLYTPYWKRVEPRLHRYRVAHGCGTGAALWVCNSR